MFHAVQRGKVYMPVYTGLRTLLFEILNSGYPYHGIFRQCSIQRTPVFSFPGHFRIYVQHFHLSLKRMLRVDIEHTYSIYLIPEKIQSVRLVIVVGKQIYDTSPHCIFPRPRYKIHSCESKAVKLVLKLFKRNCDSLRNSQHGFFHLPLTWNKLIYSFLVCYYYQILAVIITLPEIRQRTQRGRSLNLGGHILGRPLYRPDIRGRKEINIFITFYIIKVIDTSCRIVLAGKNHKMNTAFHTVRYGKSFCRRI